MNGVGFVQIERIEGLELLDSSKNKKNLLVRLDGTTLRITQPSWFSIKPSARNIFNEVNNIDRVNSGPDRLVKANMPKVVKLLSEQIKPITRQLAEEQFITKIIRLISEYFGWKLDRKSITTLIEMINNLQRKCLKAILDDFNDCYDLLDQPGCDFDDEQARFTFSSDGDWTCFRQEYINSQLGLVFSEDVTLSQSTLSDKSYVQITLGKNDTIHLLNAYSRKFLGLNDA